MRKAFKKIFFILLFMAAHFLLGFIYTFTVSLIPALTGDLNLLLDQIKVATQNALRIHLPDSIIFTALFAALIYFFICRARKQNLFAVCRFNTIKFYQVPIFVLAGISIYVVIVFLNALILITGIFDTSFSQIQTAFASFRDGNFVLAFVALVIAAPIIEEMLCRGLVMNEMRGMNVVAIIFIQALLFGINHFNLVQMISTILFGALLGFIYVWTNSIWSAIIIHSSYNSVAFFLMRFELGAFLQYYIPILLPISILVIIAIMYYLYDTRIKEHDVNSQVLKSSV